MEGFGVDDVSVGDRQVRVGAGRYRRAAYAVEPDASSASYLWAAAAITGGRVLVPGLWARVAAGRRGLRRRAGADGRRGRAGHGRRRRCGARGALRGIDVDLRDCSDTVPTLAAVACFADSPTRITGVGFIRTKETDRIGSLVAELRRCGVDAQEEPDGLRRAPRRGAPQGRPRRAPTTTTAWPWRWPCSGCGCRASRSRTRMWWPSPSRRSGRRSARSRATAELIVTSPVEVRAVRVIAIDGPAGSGKSTVARALAGRLGLDYLDTGPCTGRSPSPPCAG